ncbi:hypothetical protein HDU67_006667 [Dinochytrium kinnereticum]|nr:hypothetical protein HDU67_006667 [Dinochytrium kinnereticum]
MLRDITRPFASCATTIISSSLIITVATSVFLVIIRFLYLWTCLSSSSGKPFVEDSITFGTLAIMISRSIAVVPLANQRMLISPIIDYVLINLLISSALVAGWVFQPFLMAFEYVWKMALPLTLVNGLLCNFTIYPKRKRDESVTAYILRNLQAVIAFIILFAGYFSASISCLAFSNRRIRSYIKNDGEVTMEEEIATTLLNLFFLGFIFPLIRYAIIWLNKTVIPVWKSPKPKTRLDEIAINASKLVFVVCQESIWSTIGNIVIFRSPTYTFYYLGTLGFQIAYAVERLVACYYFKRNLKRKLSSVEPAKDVIDPSKPSDTIILEKREKEETKEEEEEEEGIGMAVFEPSRSGMNSPLSRSRTGSRMSRRSTSRSVNRRGSHASNMEERKRKQSDTDFQSRARAVFQIQEQEEEPPVFPDSIPLHISNEADSRTTFESKASGVGSVGISSFVNGDQIHQHVEQDIIASNSNILSVNADSSIFGIEIPFIPLKEEVIYGYLRIGSMIAEWSSRGVAFMITLIFITVPDFQKWTWFYSYPNVIDLAIRLVTWPFFAFICEFLCTFAESRILQLDFATSVDEFKASGLSLSGYIFLISLLSGCAGIVLIVETGVLDKNPAFEVGRRVWSQ